MLLECVLVESGTCSVIALSSHMVASVGQDTWAALALFDVGGCFEALSERMGGSRFFFLFFFPGSSCTSDNPF